LNTQDFKHCLLYAIFLLIFAVALLTSAESREAEEIAEILQHAEILFVAEQYHESYQLYRKVLDVDPLNQQALARVLDMAVRYRELAEGARQAGDTEHVNIYQRAFQQIVRYLLTVLTAQFERDVKKYTTLSAKEKEQQRAEASVILLRMIDALQYIKTIYEQFQQEEAETAQTIKRLQRAIETYQQERSAYTQ